MPILKTHNLSVADFTENENIYYLFPDNWSHQKGSNIVKILRDSDHGIPLYTGLSPIKPFDEELFLNSISKVKAVITIEEHSVSGGLGEKCASVLMQKNIHLPFTILGFPDEYMVNGSQKDVLDYYNMSAEKILEIAKKLIK